MDARTAAAIAFKILGLYFLVTGAGTLVGLVSFIDVGGARFILQVLLGAGVRLGAGALLWSSAFALASAFPASTPNGTDPDRVAHVGVALIGLVFLVLGAVEVALWAVTTGTETFGFNTGSPIPGVRGILPVLVKVGAGLGLILGSEAIGRALIGARPAPPRQPIEPNEEES